jgi:hypothetical protein
MQNIMQKQCHSAFIQSSTLPLVFSFLFGFSRKVGGKNCPASRSVLQDAASFARMQAR